MDGPLEDAPAEASQHSRFSKVVVALVVVLVGAWVVSLLRDDEDKPDVGPSLNERAEQVWDDLGVREQASICDALDQFGRTFVVDGLDGSSEAEKRAVLRVVEREC